MPKIAIPDWTHEGAARHPVLDLDYGPYCYKVLGDVAGLTQFGAHLERLPPGSRSSLRHWHDAEDELVYMLDGEVTLIEEVETLLGVGEAAAWPAGRSIGHCLENRGTTDATYLVIGTRSRDDIVHYPDDNLMLVKSGTERHYTRQDGTPLARRSPT